MPKKIFKDVVRINLLGYGLYRAWIVSLFSFAKKAACGDISCTFVLCVSIALSALLFIALYAWASFERNESSISVTALIAGFIGLLLAYFGFVLLQPKYLFIGFFLVGICSGYFEVKWGYKFLLLTDKQVYYNVLLTFFLAAAIGILSSVLVPESLFVVESIVLLGGMSICFFSKTTTPNRLFDSEHPINFYKEVSPFKTKPFMRVILTCLLFGAIQMSATSISYSSLPVGDVYHARFVANFISTLALLVIFLLRGVVSPSGLIKAILPITAAGLFLQLIDSTFLDIAPVIILLIGNKLFDVLILVFLIKLIQCAEIGPAVGFGFFVAAKNIGNLVGTLAGDFFITQMGQGTWSLSSFIALLVMLLITTLLWVFSDKTLSTSTKDILSCEATTASFDIQDKARCVASSRGLTSRETEVLILLARGKNKASIAKEQCVSKSTVHAHMMHIYQKLGVHNQQELIVLIERAND